MTMFCFCWSVLCSVFLLFLTVDHGDAYTNGIGCLDSENKPVDWFLVYKTPQDPQSKNQFIAQGVGFYYMDSRHQTATLSYTPINGKDHALYNTLQQIYLNYFVVEYGMYNDEPPDMFNKYWTRNGSSGITKGVYAFDKQTGFWLITSIPKFPPPKNKGYAFNMAAVKDGHMALCLTLNSDRIVELHKLFQVTQPHFYDGKGNNAQITRQPHLNSTLEIVMYTHDNIELKCLAKGTTYEKDLYESMVAPSLNMNLLVQTYRPDGGSTSQCTPYQVLNVAKIKFPDTAVFPSATSDRAKWAVSKTLGRWICVGDHDREASALSRSGGVLCMVNYPAWKALHYIIGSADKC